MLCRGPGGCGPPTPMPSFYRKYGRAEYQRSTRKSEAEADMNRYQQQREMSASHCRFSLTLCRFQSLTICGVATRRIDEGSPETTGGPSSSFPEGTNGSLAAEMSDYPQRRSRGTTPAGARRPPPSSCKVSTSASARRQCGLCESASRPPWKAGGHGTVPPTAPPSHAIDNPPQGHRLQDLQRTRLPHERRKPG